MDEPDSTHESGHAPQAPSIHVCVLWLQAFGYYVESRIQLRIFHHFASREFKLVRKERSDLLAPPSKSFKTALVASALLVSLSGQIKRRASSIPLGGGTSKVACTVFSETRASGVTIVEHETLIVFPKKLKKNVQETVHHKNNA